ncbi:MAG: hypothetical protein ACJA2X_002816 [Halocynthiibacter sp.]|jgi:hypothetical protein
MSEVDVGGCDVVDALVVYPFTPAQLCNAVLATQAIQHDPNLLF